MTRSPASSASTSRTSRSIAKLKGFLSDGVRTQLRDMVIADPSMIGQTRDVNVLVTANIDSAFKGQIDLKVAGSQAQGLRPAGRHG